jgi:transposase-like protein
MLNQLKITIMNAGFEIKTKKPSSNCGMFSNERKKEIVISILNRPSGMTLNDACTIFGITNPTYYEWKKKFKCSKVTLVGKNLRNFTTEEKKDIINKIDNRPSNVTKTVMFKKFGFGKGKLYYDWKKEFGTNSNVPMNVPMNVNVVKKSMTHTITLSVEVESLIELIGLCNHIGQLPKVKTVLSVE